MEQITLYRIATSKQSETEKSIKLIITGGSSFFDAVHKSKNIMSRGIQLRKICIWIKPA